MKSSLAVFVLSLGLAGANFLPSSFAEATGRADSEPTFEAYERSLAMVRAELQRNPHHADLPLILAKVHTEASRYSEALRVYKEGRRAHPKDRRFILGLGRTYLAQEEPKLAVEHFRQAVSTAPPASLMAEVRLLLAEAYMRMGNFVDAAAELRTLVGVGSPTAEVLFKLGQALDSESRRRRAQGDLESSRDLAAEARQSFEDAIRLDPQNADAHYALGRLLMRLGEKELGTERLEQFRKLKRWKTAIDENFLSLSHSSLEAGTAVDLARALLAQGEPSRALHYVARALEVQEGFVPALLMRGSIYMRTRRMEEAIAAFEEILSVHADHPPALMGLAKTYVTMENFQKAAECLLRAAKNQPEVWETLYLFAADGRAFADRVEEFARAALQARPSASNFSKLARTLFQTGKFAESEEVLKSGLARYPNDKDLATGLQIIQKARKEKP